MNVSPLLRIMPASVLISVFLIGGCATIRTVSHFTHHAPKVYSGTRLDITTISHDGLRLKVYKNSFGIEPPEHPEADLPFSIALDTLILPVPVPIASYELLFGP